MKDFRQVVLDQQKRIREEWRELAKIYPGSFDANGRPIVAELPPLPEFAALPTPAPVPPDAPPFGIIDPDYARVFTIARCLAWQEGYSCCMQGSFTRDLDLLFVPWTEAARRGEGDILVARIADATGLKLQGEPSNKPHGRKAWTLLFPGFGDPRFVDVSVMPTAASPPPQAQAQKERPDFIAGYDAGLSDGRACALRDQPPDPNVRRLTGLWRFGRDVLPTANVSFDAWLSQLDGFINGKTEPQAQAQQHPALPDSFFPLIHAYANAVRKDDGTETEFWALVSGIRALLKPAALPGEVMTDEWIDEMLLNEVGFRYDEGLQPFNATDLHNICRSVEREIRASVAATPSPVPPGWKLVQVNEGFDTLMSALERAHRKGYMPDAITDDYEGFDYRASPSTPAAAPAQGARDE